MVSGLSSARSRPTFLPEPGYYADGRYGIRIENVVIVREAKTLNDFENGYLCFEHVAMVSAFGYDKLRVKIS